MQGLGEGERWTINLSLTRQASQGNNELPSLSRRTEKGSCQTRQHPPPASRLGSTWTVPDDKQTAGPLKARESGRVLVSFKVQNLIKRCPHPTNGGKRALARTSQEMADDNYVLVLTCPEPHPRTCACSHKKRPFSRGRRGWA